MPLTAHEIKARLDKVVDQEGNVLDMDATLDIVSVLEKLPMTKEALESTRIGRTINVMRKNTKNPELARRAKKLLKKWQALVNSHLRHMKLESPAPSRSSTPTLNGPTPTRSVTPIVNGFSLAEPLQVDRPKSCTTELSLVPAQKRKRLSDNSASQNVAPLDPSRVRAADDSLVDGKVVLPAYSKATKVNSPRIEFLSNTSDSARTSPKSSPAVHALSRHALAASSSLPPTVATHISRISNGSSRLTDIAAYVTTDASSNENRIARSSSRQELESCRVDSRAPTLRRASPADSVLGVSPPSESLERVDAIAARSDEGLPGRCSTDAERNVSASSVKTHSPPEVFDIAEEELAPVRRDLPDDVTDPASLGDGVNGTFSCRGTWHDWSSTLPGDSGCSKLIVLPYVILE